MVDLIEDHERAAGLGALHVQRRMGRDLRIGDRHPGEVGAGGAVGIAET